MNERARRAGEFGLIDWVREHTPARGRAVVGIGDDCAVLRPAAGADWLVTTDMLMDGRHFRPRSRRPRGGRVQGAGR